jgi:hypothetical protein
MADTFVDMNHEYDNDPVNVLEAIAAASDKAVSIRGSICVKIVQISDSSSQ